MRVAAGVELEVRRGPGAFVTAQSQDTDVACQLDNALSLERRIRPDVAGLFPYPRFSIRERWSVSNETTGVS